MSIHRRFRRIPTIAAVTATVAVGLLAAACSSTPQSSGASRPPAATKAKTSAVVVKTASNARLGTILTNASGLTLYRLTTDHGGQSTCTGACLTTWPPLLVNADTTPELSGAPGTLSVDKQANGTDQVAYDGMLLYTYAGDSAPGQTNGQGLGGVWFVVPASAGGSGSSGSTPATTSTTRAESGGY